MKTKHNTLAFFSFFLLSYCCLLLPAAASAEHLVYTVQTGSFQDRQRAETAFEQFASRLSPGDSDFLRIEEVQGYFTVRIGRFERRREAAVLLKAVKRLHPDSIVLQAYIKEERIRRTLHPGDEKEAGESRETETGSPGSPEPPGAGKAEAPVEGIEKPVKRERVPEAAISGAGGGAEAGRIQRSEKTAEPQESPSPDFADLPAETMPPPEPDMNGLRKGSAEAAPPRGLLPVRPLAVLSSDDQGRKFGFVNIVFHDREMNETYVLTSSEAGGRLVVYGGDYYPVASLGKGRRLLSPQDLVVDKGGRLYVAQYARDGKPNRLSVFNAAFFLEREITFDGFAGAEKFRPQRLAVAADGTFYVSGYEKRGVVVLDPDGNFLRWLVPLKEGTKGERPARDPDHAGAEYVADLIIDDNGRIYLLSEQSSRISVYNDQEEFLFAFGTKGGSSGKLSRPRSLAVDEARKVIYVVDYMRHTVLVYDYFGRYLFELGGRGFGPGWFNFPTHAAVGNRGELIIADLFNYRVQVLEVR